MNKYRKNKNFFNNLSAIFIAISLAIIPVSAHAYGGGGYSGGGGNGNGNGGGFGIGGGTETGSGSSSSSSGSSSTSTVNTNDPQVVFILDNSQSMAEIIPNSGGTGSDGTNGIAGSSFEDEGIYTGSGLVADNSSSSSPTNYPVNGYTPRVVAPDSSGNAPYTVSCGTAGLSTLDSTTCTDLGGSGAYLDNSESLINVAEQAIDYVLASPNIQNLNVGLVDYQVQGNPSIYDSWVYYMSGPTGFDFSTSATASFTDGNTVVVNNPCYNQDTTSCKTIADTDSQTGKNYGTYNAKGANYEQSAMYLDPYMYVEATSDNPDIVDILYASGLQNNVLSYGGGTLNNYTLSGYESQNTSSIYPYSTDGLTETTPTSSGYIPNSQEVWYSERGEAFNASVNSGSGNVVSALQEYSATESSALEQDIAPEGFATGYNSSYPEIEPDAGYSPMDGALTTAAGQFVTGCQGKYVILITDGQPTMGINGNVYPPVGSEAADALYSSATPQASYSSTGAFISSQNKALTETITQIQTMANEGIDTFVIGVGPALSGTSAEDKASYAALNAMAIAGNTDQVYNASSPSDVQNALNSVIAKIAGSVVTASAGAAPSLNTGNNEYLLTNNSESGEGNLSAYAINTNGTPDSSATWTAEASTNTTERETSLYSVGANLSNGNPGNITEISNLTTAYGAMPTGSGLTPAIIADYTANPDYSSGKYLGGRNDTWLTGLTSQATPLIVSSPDNAYLFNAPGYLNYAGSNQNVKQSVLFSDNDGFLYSYGLQGVGDSQTGTFEWGFMPRGLVADLSNYNSFWEGNNQGGFTSVNAVNSSGVWGTYIVGEAADGGILYGIEVTANSNGYYQPTSEVYEDDLGSSYYEPIQGNPTIAQSDTTGVAYALYVVNTGTGTGETSSLYGFNVANPQDSFVDALPFVATSQPAIDSLGNVYIGDSNGNVWESTIANVITYTPTSFSNIGNYGVSQYGGIDPIDYIQIANENGTNYLVAEGSNRITVFQQNPSVWEPSWTSYAGGSGTWSNGVYTENSSSGLSLSTIQAIPTTGSISAAAVIVSGVVDLPVTVSSVASDACTSNAAYNYFYNLNNGYFPANGIVPYGPDQTLENLLVGSGNAFTPTVSTFNGKLFIQTTASLNTAGQSGLSTAFYAGELPVGGPVGWREIFNQ